MFPGTPEAQEVLLNPRDLQVSTDLSVKSGAEKTRFPPPVIKLTEANLKAGKETGRFEFAAA